MHPRCAPPGFDQDGWSGLDWRPEPLDGGRLDATTAALADLARRLFGSEEWHREIAATLPDLQAQVHRFYQEHDRLLRSERALVAQDFDERISVALRRHDDFMKLLAATPPEMRSEREARAQSLAGRLVRLRQERDERLRDLDRSLEDNALIIAALDQEISSRPAPGGGSPPGSGRAPRS